MKKTLRTFLVIFIMLALCVGAIPAFAQDPHNDEQLKVGENFEFDGEIYTVYMVDENGAHITKDWKFPMASPCPPHDYVLLAGETYKTVKINNHSTSCYTKYTYVRSRCRKCGGLVVSQKSSTTTSHKYKLLGKKCTNSINGSTCNYAK